jgi:hypothetical protein
MHKILITVAMSLAMTASAAPVISDKKVACFPLKQLVSILLDRYGEEPMLFGVSERNEDIGVGVYINKQTGTYTIIEFNKDAACVLSVGQNIQYRYPQNTLAPIS